jgi:hypothetical protein
VERRTALKIIAGGAIAGQFGVGQLGAAPWTMGAITEDSAAYYLQFFSPAQNGLLDRLSDIIIPTDDHSPGAHEAKVSLFIDLMVANSDKKVQDAWVDGLKAVDAEAQNRFQRSFLACDAQQQDQIVAAMAKNENGKSNTELELFFTRLKSMTIDGYYTSAIGIHKDLRYIGHEVLAEYVGCTHPEHQA